MKKSIFVFLFMSCFVAAANASFSLVGTWQLSSIGCEKSDGSFSASTLATQLNKIISTEISFQEDGKFTLETDVPFICNISMSGTFSLHNNDELTLDISDAAAVDGAKYSCPGSNQAKAGLKIQPIRVLEENKFYLIDEDNPNGKGRCEPGETPVQLFIRL